MVDRSRIKLADAVIETSKIVDTKTSETMTSIKDKPRRRVVCRARWIGTIIGHSPHELPFATSTRWFDASTLGLLSSLAVVHCERPFQQTMPL